MREDPRDAVADESPSEDVGPILNLMAQLVVIIFRIHMTWPRLTQDCMLSSRARFIWLRAGGEIGFRGAFHRLR